MAKEMTGIVWLYRVHRLYESLVTVPGRGDLLGFKINGAGFVILARKIFATLTFTNVQARPRVKERGKGREEEEVGSHKEMPEEIGKGR